MWFRKKKNLEPLYRLVDQEIELEELEGHVTLHLSDGTIVKYKLTGRVNKWNGMFHPQYGEVRYDSKFYKSSQGYFSNASFVVPEIEQTGYYRGQESISYINESGVKVDVNPSHVMQKSRDVKVTGNKIKVTIQKVEKI